MGAAMNFWNQTAGRRAFVTGLGASIAVSAADCLDKRFQTIKLSQRDFTVDATRSLKARLAAKGRVYGTAARYIALTTDTEFADRVVQDCGMLVPEWELKWGTLRPSPDRFDFAQADWLADFARTHAMQFRGHTLLWHEDLPPWFDSTVNASNAEQFLTNHIQTVVKHYAGRIQSWDVVNEAIQVTGDHANNLRKTPWLKFLGADYIELAFKLAAEADPNALLVYNDYGTEYDTIEGESRRTAILQLLKTLKSKGAPVQALGIQAHLSGSETRFNPAKFKAFLSAVASLGLKILVTELDVSDRGLPLDIGQRDQTVAAAYEDFLSVALQEPAVIAVLTWGLSDRYTWLSEYAQRDDRAAVRTLPLDRDLQRKLAWNAMARAFDRAVAVQR
jgi:endo-1,4-beta-xylanase